MSLRPRDRLASFVTRKPSEYEDVLDLLLQALQYQEPEPHIFQEQYNITASQNITKIYEPQDDQTEWLVYAFTIQDVVNVDSLDAVIASYGVYATASTAYGIDLWNAKNGESGYDISGDPVVAWPVPYEHTFTLGTPHITVVPSRDSALRLYKRTNKERYALLSIQWIATATVGTRTIRTKILYGSRPRLH